MSKEDRIFDSLMKLLTKYAKQNNFKECANILQNALKMKPNDAELYRKIGWVYLYDGLSEKALECFRRSLELKGNRARAYCGIGATKFLQKSFSSALRNLGRSLSLGLDTWDVHYYLGVTYEKLERLREAFDHLAKSADRNCPNAYCYNFLGEQLLKEKKYAEAEQKLLRAIELKLENARTHYFLGVIYTKEQRSGLAIKHLKICLKSGLRLPAVYRDLGIAYMGKELPEKAEEQFKKIVKMNLKSPTGFEELCFLYIQRKKLDLAQECLEKARERGLPDDRWYAILGSISKAKGEVQSAIRYNKLALKNNPNNGLVHAQFGNLYDNQGNTSKAIFHFKKAFLIDPGVISTPFSLGLIYLRENKLTLSKKLIATLAAINEENPLVQTLLAGYYLRKRNMKLAKRCAQKAIALDNALATGYYMQYMIHRLDSDPQQSLDFLEKAISLGAEAVGADFFSLGLTFYGKGMFGKAKLCLQKVIEIDPECGDAYFPLATLIIFREANYGLAHSMIELSERKPWRLLKHEDFETMIAHAKTFFSGMMSWQKGEFNIAKNHFLECAKISESANLTDWDKDGQFLASIVSFDERISLLTSAPSFPVIMQGLDKLLREINTVTKEVLKESEKDNLLSLPIILAKGAIVLALIKILVECSLDSKCREWLNKAQKRLENVKLVRSIVVFDLIDTFAFEFSNVIAEFKELDRVPAEIVNSLLRSFRDILEHLGGKMSVESMRDKCLTIIEPYLRNIQTEIMSRRGMFEDLDRFLKMQPETLEEFREKEQAMQKKINVIFCEDRIEISDAKPFSKDYSMRLIERVILRRAVRGREKMHWLWAYVTFPKFKATNPKRQVRNYVSKKRRQLEKYGIRIMPLSKEEDNFIILEKISENVVSNIKDAMEWYKEAVSLYEDEKPKEAIKKLSKIVESDYRWYSFTESYMQLAKWILEINFKGIPEDLIDRSKDFLASYGKKLKSGILQIEAYRRKIGTNLDEESEGELERIRKELEEVEKYFLALIERRPWAIEDDKYEVLAGLLQENREQLELIREENLFIGQREEEHNRLIENLQKENRQIGKIIENSLEFWEREQERLTMGKTERGVKEFEDMKRWIHCSLAEIIEKFISFEDFERKGVNKLGSLKNYLFEELEKRIKRKLGISRY